MTQLDDIKIPLEIDRNMILIDLAHSVYQRYHEWLVIGVRGKFWLPGADHVTIESEIQHWLNEYIQLHFSDRR